MFSEDENKFISGFKIGVKYFFKAIDSFDNTCTLINETKNIAYDNLVKNSVYRIPVYNDILENVLMNYYRSIGCVLNELRDKDYISQNTIGEIIPVLKKEKLKESVNIDKNLRNSLNHGQFYNFGDENIYTYHNGKNQITKKLYAFEFDDKIDESFDIASGMLIGILRFIASKEQLIVQLFEMEDETKAGMIKILYRSKNTHIRLVNTSSDMKQINFHINTSIMEKTKLGICLTELLRCMYLYYGNHEAYFIGYNHPRSVTGFMRRGFKSEVRIES